MAVTGNYKEYERQPRVMTVEDLFNFGMSYVNTPLEEGYAKLLVNFDLKNLGTSLTPRSGLKQKGAHVANTTLPGTHTYAIHHVGSTLVATADEADATPHKYILVAAVVIHHALGTKCFSLAQSYVFVETSTGYLCAPITAAYYSSIRPALKDVHGVSVQGIDECKEGVYTSIAANTYLPVYDATNTTRLFVRLNLKYNVDGTIAATLPVLEPKEVPASQVVNSGYNMMQPDPYAFQNTENATGGLTLGGILPKDLNNKLKLSTAVGEAVRYHLNYAYPTADAAKRYLVQWEVVDATTGTSSQVLQQVRRSAAYTPGDPIFLDYTIGYKQFTVVVKVYYKDVVDAHAYVSDEDDAKSLTPIQVITVSSYASSNSSKNTTNLVAKKYDLTTCAGMCVWQQRVVLWGVKDATTTLFVSQPNLPEYVAYPNDVEIFNEDIITCIPYLDFLLVFTSSKLYKLSFTTDGINVYYTTKCIQEHLPMTREDASTIQVVKNLVYFKSNNYFYMIVPNNNAGPGELQLAPISRPIEYLLDTFQSTVPEIIDEVYNIPQKFDLAAGADDYYDTALLSYYNYIDGEAVCNVYKYLLNVYKGGVLIAAYHLDYTLNYNVVARAWTSYLYESTPFYMVPYERSVTQGITFASLLHTSISDKSVSMNLFQFDSTSPKDEAPVKGDGTVRTFLNHQLINTGYRAHYASYKKRFREMQFAINNTLQNALQFYTAFIMDDDIRKDLFTHTVQHIVDETDPDYGLIYVERTLADPVSLPGKINSVDTGWTLDFSKFPNLTLSKVRYRVSGKGYCGKIKILSTNEVPYELLNINWVYRKMNGR